MFIQSKLSVSCSFTASVPVPSEPVAASSVLCGRAHGWDWHHGGDRAQSAGSTPSTDDPSSATLHLFLLRRALTFLPGIWDLVRLHALWQIFTFQEELQQAHVHPLRYVHVTVIDQLRVCYTSVKRTKINCIVTYAVFQHSPHYHLPLRSA